MKQVALASLLFLLSAPCWASPQASVPAKAGHPVTKAKAGKVQVRAKSSSHGKLQTKSPVEKKDAGVASEADQFARVLSMKAFLTKMMEAIKAQVHVLMPDPAAYEKSLPTFEKIVADKDKLNLRNYGGLSEAFILGGDRDHGEKLYSFFSANRELLADDNYFALVEGDMGLFYYTEGKAAKAEPLLLDSIKQLQSHLTAAVANNLVTDYLCMTLICNEAGRTAEAKEYARKLVELAHKQRTQAF